MAFAACVRLFRNTWSGSFETWVEATRSINTGTSIVRSYVGAVLFTVPTIPQGRKTSYHDVHKERWIVSSSIVFNPSQPNAQFSIHGIEEANEKKAQKTFYGKENFLSAKIKSCHVLEAETTNFSSRLPSNIEKWVEMFTSMGCGNLIRKELKWNLWLCFHLKVAFRKLSTKKF